MPCMKNQHIARPLPTQDNALKVNDNIHEFSEWDGRHNTRY
jgi:hypothetical protein